MTYSERYDIREIAEAIIEKMGGDPDSINNGDCDTFAMRLIDAVGRGVIVYNEKFVRENCPEKLADSGYEIRETEVNSWAAPHCYVEINGWFFDAFDPQGVENESDLEYAERIESFVA